MKRRRALVLLLLAATLVIGTGVWVCHRAPPSGLERLEAELAACRKAGMIVEPKAFRLPEILEAENAAGDYMRAIEAMGAKTLWPADIRDLWNLLIRTEANQAWNADLIDAAETLVTHFQTTLSLFHEGALKPHCQYPPDASGGDWGSTRVRSHLEAARLLEVASRLSLERGRPAEAAARISDLLQLRRGLVKSPSLIASTGCAVMLRIASRRLVALADCGAIPPTMLRALGDALPTRAELTESLRRGINGDWVFLLAEPLRDLRAGAGHLAEQWHAADLAFIIRQSRLAWQRAEHPSHLYRTLPPLPEPPKMYVLSTMLTIDYDMTVRSRDVATAWVELTRTVLDLELGRAAGGAYDELLQELTSGTWRHVEADPFTGKPYRCERVGEGYRLWSAGGDGRDDGGDPDKDIVVEVRTGRPAELAELITPRAPTGSKSPTPTTGPNWRQYWRDRMKERSQPSSP